MDKNVGKSTEEQVVRVLRVIEYVGPRAAVEDAVARSVHGTKRLPNGLAINAATIGAHPEQLTVIIPSDTAVRDVAKKLLHQIRDEARICTGQESRLAAALEIYLHCTRPADQINQLAGSTK